MKFSKVFLAVTLVVVGLGLYAPGFGNAMFWDDDDFILHNAYIQDTQYLPKLFTENVIAGSGLISNYWRPLLLLVFSAEWHAWGTWVVGWHAVNAIFHTANAVLLFYFLSQILSWLRSESARTEVARHNPSWVAYVVALLFLVHPVQVEAVAYVNSLGDSLSTFWLFLGLTLYGKYVGGRKSWAYVGALCAYPLALLSKETAIILPGLILLVDMVVVLPTVRPRVVYRWFLGAVGRVGPFFLLGISYVFARITVLNFKNSLNLYDQATAYSENVWLRLLTFFKVVWTYVQLLIWPRVLHMERHMDVATAWYNLPVLAGLTVLMVLCLGAWWAWRRGSRVPFFGLLWFCIALAPTSNIAVPINGVLYEHWLYVPIIGIAVFVSYWCTQLVSFWRKWVGRHAHVQERVGVRAVQYGGICIVALLICAYAVRSELRIQEWANPVTFYKQTLMHAPDSYRIINNLAMELANQGDLAESIPYYKQAIALDPKNPIAFYNLGNSYAALGQKNTALALYQQSLNIDPGFVYAYRPTLRLLWEAGNTEAVKQVLAQYVQVRGGLDSDLVPLAAQVQGEVK